MARDFRAVLDEIKERIADQDERLEKALREKGLTRENLRAFARGEHLSAKKRMDLARAAQRLDEELGEIARPAPAAAAPAPSPKLFPRPASSWLRA